MTPADAQPMGRTVALSILDRVSVAPPCTVSWDDMTGDHTVRHCGQCDLNVYNLSAMTAEQAAAFIGSRESRACVRFFRRADGTMITRDCPVGLRALRLKARRAAGRIAAAVALALGGAFALGMSRTSGTKARQAEPFATLCRWISPQPAPAPVAIIGDVCIAPAATPPAKTGGR